MTPFDDCQFCKEFDFGKCGSDYPCEKLILEINTLGICFKPNNDRDPITKNFEAKFIELSERNTQKFYHSAFNLATKTKLTPVTTFEINILGRQIKDENFRSKYFHDSNDNFILVPEGWAIEIRTILKYLLRLHTQDFYLSFNFIEKVAMKVDPLKPLTVDKCKLENDFIYHKYIFFYLVPAFAFSRINPAAEKVKSCKEVANNNEVGNLFQTKELSVYKSKLISNEGRKI